VQKVKKLPGSLASGTGGGQGVTGPSRVMMARTGKDVTGLERQRGARVSSSRGVQSHPSRPFTDANGISWGGEEQK